MSKQLRQHQTIVPGNPMAVSVVKTKRNPNGDIAGAIRGWKSKLKTAGTIETLKANKEYTKPSVKRREERKTRTYNCQKRWAHMFD